MNRGIWYAIGAYTAWGLLPIYWKWLHAVPAMQVVGHRILWSSLTLGVAIVLTRQVTAYRRAVWHPLALKTYLIAAVLIGVNWLTFLWAVNHNQILATSLGYFINPLLSMLLGMVLLRERLRPWQWLPVALAACGVGYLAVASGGVPWTALALAGSFALYGLVKKTAPLGAVFGLTLETMMLLVPSLVYLLLADHHGDGAWRAVGWDVRLLLMATGVVTTVPLLMFAAAAKRIPLAQVGILQYIAPTLQFLVGWRLYHEPFTHAQFVGFGAVWIALLAYAAEGYFAHRARQQSAAAAAAEEEELPLA